MEMLVVLFFVFLGVILIGSIMGFISFGRISKLEKQNKSLNLRIKALESQPAARPKTERTLAAPQAPPPAELAPPETVQKPSEAVPMPAPAPIMAATANTEKTLTQNPKAPTPAVSKQTSKRPKPQPKPRKPTRSLEELIGGQWSVWVGGFALLIGAILLIRFSIEAGIFGPGMRILMAMGLGIALLLAGEWLKRSDDKMLKGKLGEAAKALQVNASVPGLLSAVGVFTLLGASYAAHELYGFISAPVAFAALGIISVGAMVLSLRQGPLLAAIGLLASFATPLLIQTQTPNFMALVGYLLVIGLAAIALAQRTHWRWLEIGTVFGWLIWGAISLKAALTGQMGLWAIFLAIGFAVSVWRSEDASENRPPAEHSAGKGLDAIVFHPYLAVIWSAIAALLIMFVCSETWQGPGTLKGVPIPTLILSIATAATLMGAAILFKRQSGHIIIAGLFAWGLNWGQYPSWQLAIFIGLIVAAILLSLRENWHFKAQSKGKGKVKGKGESKGAFWIIFAIGLSVLSFLGFQFHGENIWPKEAYVILGLGYSALFSGFAYYSHSKSRPRLYAVCATVGAGLLWIISWSIQLDGLAFSLAMSLGAALMVAAFWALRLPGARLGILGLAGLVFLHALNVQFPNPESLSSRPILNALWAYLAMPTAILGAAAYLLRSRPSESKIDRFTKIDGFVNGLIEAAALGGLALFAVFQIRHLSNNGIVYADKLGFEELGLQVSIGLCFTLAGLSKRFSGNQLLSKMAEIISYVTLATFALGSLLALSPLFNSQELITGNLLFNSLTTGLLVPTALMGLCAWLARGRRSEVYVNALGGLSLAGAIMCVTGIIRYIYNGASIDIFRVNCESLELWTISFVWLLIGISMLAIGVWKRERAFRLASGVVIILTVLKAFLIDMAGLEGVLRALSFVVLGLVLIVIGRAYQRFWLSDGASEKDISDKIA